jgi:DNA primase
METARIEEVIGDFVNLKRSGVNMKGLSPFTTEKTPSFYVSPSKGIYKCFSSGKGGNVVSFLMEAERMTYVEALRWLARRYHIEIEETKQDDRFEEERKQADSLYLLNEFAQQYFVQQLWDTERGKQIGLSYFKERGFLDDTIRKFGLGYAVDGNNALLQAAQTAGHKKELLQKAGLVTEHGRDFFWNRVMFPIHNVAGKIVGFAGRIMDANAKASKYINTPETDIYNKSKLLYGIYLAKQAIRKADECLLVEGYTDVISLHQWGIENVVASSGTALTPQQVQLVKRYTPNLTILYDGDAAGIKAALRGLDIALEEDMNVRIVQLPTPEDPDSYMRKVGAEAFAQYIRTHADDFILFKTRLLLDETKNDPVKRAASIKDIVQSIAKMPDALKRAVYIKECVALTGIDEQALLTEVHKLVRKQLTDRAAKEKAGAAPNDPLEGLSAATPNTPDDSLLAEIQRRTPQKLTDEWQEKYIVGLLITNGHKAFEDEITVAEFILADMDELLDEFDSHTYRQFVIDYMIELARETQPNTHYFLNHPDDQIRQMAVDFVATRHEYSPNWELKHHLPLQSQPALEENFRNDAISAIRYLKYKKIIRISKKNLERIQKLHHTDTDLVPALQLQMRLKDMGRELAKLLRIDGAISL